MAQQTTNPALAKLMNQAGAWNQARTQKNPFRSDVTAPDGLYYARVNSAKLQLTKKKDPMAIIGLVLICDENGDQTYAGEQPRLMHVFAPTEKSTVADKFARFCYDLQDLGLDTTQLEITEIEEALKWLVQEKPYTKVSVQRNEGFANPSFFLQGLVTEDDIKQLGASTEVQSEEGDGEEEETPAEEGGEEEGYSSEYEEVGDGESGEGEEAGGEESGEEEAPAEEAPPPPKPAAPKPAPKPVAGPPKKPAGGAPPKPAPVKKTVPGKTAPAPTPKKLPKKVLPAKR